MVGFVTGAAGAIGRAITQRLLRDGFTVVAFDRDPAVEGLSTLGVVAFVGDVRSSSDLAQATTLAEKRGPLVALVNNAAVVEVPRRGFEDIPEDEWDEMMAVNLGGVWNATKVVAPAMRRAGGGSIVNVSSDAVLSGIPGLAHYVASKGAVTSLTRVLASELGKDRVRVNALAVGFTETPAALAHGSEAAGRSVERRALSRPQVVDDVVGTVSWLLSPDSAFVTGQLIAVNGGYVFH